MLREEDLRVFVALFKKHESQTFDKMKRSFILMDSSLKAFMKKYWLLSQEELSLAGGVVEYEKLKQQVPRLLIRINTLYLEMNLPLLLKEIQENCKLLIKSADEVLDNSQLIERTT